MVGGTISQVIRSHHHRLQRRRPGARPLLLAGPSQARPWSFRQKIPSNGCSGRKSPHIRSVPRSAPSRGTWADRCPSRKSAQFREPGLGSRGLTNISEETASASDPIPFQFFDNPAVARRNDCHSRFKVAFMKVKGDGTTEGQADWRRHLCATQREAKSP
jgi:hypothetical protein